MQRFMAQRSSIVNYLKRPQLRKKALNSWYSVLDTFYSRVARMLKSIEQSNCETPSNFSAKNGCNKAARVLLNYGADAKARTHAGFTPFSHIPTTLVDEKFHQLVNPFIGLMNIIKGNTSNGSQPVEEPKNYENGIQGKMDEFDHELSKIVGLRELKSQLRKWAKASLLDEKRRERGRNLGPRKSPHMAFLGNPGTGKTTVARTMGKLLKSVGILSSDKVIEVQRTDLIAEYQGQTGAKTRKKIEEAEGGILFVDEAYQLVRDSDLDYGKEALEEIMSVLEDGNLVVIFAGHIEPMKRVFSSHQGFRRKFNDHVRFFEFENFTCDDLAEMLMLKMTKQNKVSQLYGLKFDPLCTFDVVKGIIERNSSEKLRNKMNGGLVDHMLNYARREMNKRLTR